MYLNDVYYRPYFILDRHVQVFEFSDAKVDGFFFRSTGLRLGLQVRMRSSLQKHLGLRKCHLERRGRLLKEDDII